MTRLAVVAAAFALSAAPAGLAGPPSLGCGMLAPFGTSCVDCCLPLGAAPQVEANLLGYVGALEMRLEGALGAWVWWCWTVGVDEPIPAPVEECSGPEPEGTPPVEGESVALRCLARPLPQGEGLVGPAGPWGCRAYP